MKPVRQSDTKIFHGNLKQSAIRHTENWSTKTSRDMTEPQPFYVTKPRRLLIMQIRKQQTEGTAIPSIDVQEAGITETLARLYPGFLVTVAPSLNTESFWVKHPQIMTPSTVRRSDRVVIRRSDRTNCTPE